MSTDYKKLIEQATIVPAQKLFINSEGELTAPDYYLYYNAGAALPNELLLKALNALNKLEENLSASDEYICLGIINEAVSEIREALEAVK